MKARTLVALVAAQRLAELVWARTNERRLRAAGAVEHGAAHYPAIVALHAAWLAAMWTSARPGRDADPRWLSVYGALQMGRAWVLATLGRRWTARVLTVAGETAVTRGPFRLLRHPNYAVVAGEIAALPLALGRPRLALLFTLLNAAALTVRIRAESRAWAAR